MKHTTSRLAAALLVTTALAAGTAKAQDQKAVQFDLASQSLSQSLREFSQVSGQQIVFSEDVVRGVQAPPVHGTHTPQQALSILLADTGLIAERARAGAIMVKRKNEQSSNARGANPTRAGRVVVGPLATPTQTAQVQNAPDERSDAAYDSIEQVIVSATRVDRSGFDAPTPVTTLTAEDLRAGARPNIAAALQDLPQFKATRSPQNSAASSTAAISSIDLRGLTGFGAPRTLVLLDGRRFLGDLDLNLIPSTLVSRIDIVTGGSSAAWGSGAVAGVANIVINEKLAGLRAGVQGAISSRGDTEEWQISGAGGTSFANGRGHVVVGGEYVDSEGLFTKCARVNTCRWAVVTNPNYTPTNGQKQNIIAPDVGIATVSPGGLILSGVNAGRAFNPDGTLRAFDLGRISGSSSVGGEAPSDDDVLGLLPPSSRYAFLGRGTYELTDDVKLTAELRYGRIYSDPFSFFSIANRGNLTINIDNAFLPAAVRSQMAAANQSSFTFGRFNADFALSTIEYERKLAEATLALDGRFGDDWRWDAYYSHGESDESNVVRGQTITARLTRSVDSVVNPATGQPTCRVNIDTNPANDDPACVPINLFGEGAPSQAARAYVLGDGGKHTTRKLDVGGVSLRGEPFALWAGPVSLAVGAEARREYILTEVTANDSARVLGLFNQIAFPASSMTTKEGFAETVVPLVKDVPGFQLMELDVAGRITDDISGSVWSWKIGGTNSVTDSLKFRAALSRDIRSPSLAELFLPVAQTQSVIIDPAKGNQPYTLITTTGRNPALAAEISETTSAGVIVTPESIQGLRLSVDYFDIDIAGAIGSIAPQDRVTRCFNGNQALCAGVTRAPDGTLTAITGSLVNLSNFETAGFDASFAYSFPLSSLFDAAGTLGINSNLTYLTDFRTFDDISVVDFIGTQGTGFTFGVPRARWNTTLSYDAGRIHADIRSRFISAGYYNKNLSIENNRIPAYVYFDLGLNWKIATANDHEFDIYANVNNLFDKDPPIESRNSHYYDVLGTYFTLGLRTKF